MTTVVEQSNPYITTEKIAQWQAHADALGKSQTNLAIVINALRSKDCNCSPFDDIKTYNGWIQLGKENGAHCHIAKGSKKLVSVQTFGKDENTQRTRMYMAHLFCACNVCFDESCRKA